MIVERCFQSPEKNLKYQISLAKMRKKPFPFVFCLETNKLWISFIELQDAPSQHCRNSNLHQGRFQPFCLTTRGMEREIRSVTSSSRLLALPLELRRQIYDEYFFRCSSPYLEHIHENVVPKDKNYTLAILLVSKQVCEEILDILKRRRRYVYRITWQEAGLDNLAILCIRARKIQCDDYASIPHLRIELYPPHPDRPSDMMNTLRSIQELCKDLRAIDRLQHISIVFVENYFAAWSTSGKPRMSMGYWQELE